MNLFFNAAATAGTVRGRLRMALVARRVCALAHAGIDVDFDRRGHHAE